MSGAASQVADPNPSRCGVPRGTAALTASGITGAILPPQRHSHYRGSVPASTARARAVFSRCRGSAQRRGAARLLSPALRHLEAVEMPRPARRKVCTQKGSPREYGRSATSDCVRKRPGSQDRRARAEGGVYWPDTREGDALMSFRVIRGAVLTVALATAWLAAGAARSAGPVVGWGDNSFDQNLGTATAIAAGSYHSCAIQAGTGRVVCWGSNYDVSNIYQGQATPPAAVDGKLGTASAITAGGYHSCAIQAGTGHVVCWGNNSGGQATPPPSVDGTAGTATAIAAGYSHSCAVQEGTAKVVCWGYNDEGQTTPPASVDGTAGTATAISAGGLHTLAIAAPEPATALLSAASLGSLLALARRRRLR